MPEFRRKRLPHDTPHWATNGASYFVTICATPRGGNIFAKECIATSIYDATKHYHQSGRWYAELLLVMPDHIHGIFSFNLEHYKLQGMFNPFKGYLSRLFEIQWQEGFFEHRLRDDHEYLMKADYIRKNPVRAGLVEQAVDWPYCWSAFAK